MLFSFLELTAAALLGVGAGAAAGRLLARRRAAGSVRPDGDKAAEAGLNEQRIRLALRSADICIFNTDLEGRYTWVLNPLFGLTAEAIVGKAARDVLPPAIAGRLDAVRGQLIAHGGHFQETVDYDSLSGEPRALSVSLEPLRDDDGEIIGMVGACTDVFELRRLDAELRHSQRQETLGRLTGGIAHDFNNLLAVIAGNLEMLREQTTERRDLQRLVDAASRAAERGERLTQSLQAFAGQQVLQVTQLALDAFLHDMVELVRRTLSANVDINLRVNPDLWPCLTDPGQLQHAVLNIVLNARDAMPEGGQLGICAINVTLHAADVAGQPDVVPGDYVALMFSDSGRGMSEATLRQAFDPFFTTKAQSDGRGLGLSMVYGFARQCGGHVAIRSSEGEGTVVSLYLPRAESGVVTSLGPELATTGTATATTENRRRPVVLVVEDDQDVRTLVRSMLTVEGYAVIDAATGREALMQLRALPTLDAILSDVILAGDLSGPDMVAEAHRLRPGLPVLFMSGYTEGALGQDSRYTLIQKPFRRRALVDALRQVMSAASDN